jgi:SNF2 family DNA or RNA helicase
MQEIARWAPDLRVLAYYGSMEERLLLRHSARKYQASGVERLK